MAGQTFAEKILGAPVGSIVFRRPDLILSHDNTISIYNTFKRMGGRRVADPARHVVALDHNAPPTTIGLANDYQAITDLVREQGLAHFHPPGDGISHQLMSAYARPGMLIVGADSHTSTSGAFNTFAAGIDRTEAAGFWLRGESWFRVPESLKVVLRGRLPAGVYAKDIALWLIGRLGSAGANYRCVEFHGDIAQLPLAERMVLTNLCAEMGAKTGVFPCDEVLRAALASDSGSDAGAVWADADARYADVVELALDELFPVVSAPHQVDNVRAVSQVAGTRINQALVGTCTNGRIEDLAQAAAQLQGRPVHPDVQLLIIPASRAVYVEALERGYVKTFVAAGAQVLSASCGPCPGTGQGIPADGWVSISTANRNFKGRMGNPQASIYLASPATVAASAVAGVIADPRGGGAHDVYPHAAPQSATVEIAPGDNRLHGNVWHYADVDNLNTDQMFAGDVTYKIKSSDPAAVRPHLFKGLDASFAERVGAGQIIVAGENLGCGSSREHPAVGLAHAGVRAVLCKSAARIFFRSAINQGLPVMILPEAVAAYRPGDEVLVDFAAGRVQVGGRGFDFAPLPAQLLEILQAGGLLAYLRRAGGA